MKIYIENKNLLFLCIYLRLFKVLNLFVWLDYDDNFDKFVDEYDNDGGDDYADQ